MIDTPTGYTSVTTDDGATIVSSSETTEQITESLKPEPPPEAEPEPPKETDPRLSKAASKLGKAGGEAAAAKRAAEAKEQTEAENADDAPAATEGAPEKKLGKPRDDPRARMLEATRKEAEAKREAARLAARVAELEARQAKPAEEPKPAGQPKPTEGKPKVEDFERYEDFVEALADHKANERLQTFQRESQVRAQQAARHESISYAVQTFAGRLEEAATTDSTFKERTVAVAEMLQPSFTLGPGERVGPLNVVADEVIRSERAPALMLHLAEHPEEIQRFQALRTPADVQVEVRLLAKSLAAAPTATAPRHEVSQALPPTRHVVGSPSGHDQMPGEEASYEDHKRFWNARDRAARR